MKNKSKKASQSQDRPVSPLEEQLHETALGGWISENKGAAISVIAIILSSVLGYGGWLIHQSNKAEAAAEAVYAFEQQVLEPFMGQEKSGDEVVNRWRELSSEHRGQKALYPVLLFISDELIRRGELEGAHELLLEGSELFRGDFVQYFVGMRLAVVQEDLGYISQAIKTLEKLEQSPLALMDSKVYLDLGRLYMREGEYQKARMSFEYVTQHMAQDEFASLARVYLAELDGREDRQNEESNPETSFVTP